MTKPRADDRDADAVSGGICAPADCAAGGRAGRARNKNTNKKDAAAPSAGGIDVCNSWNNPCATTSGVVPKYGGGGDDEDSDSGSGAPPTLKFTNPRPDLDDDSVSPLPSPTPAAYHTTSPMTVPFDEAGGRRSYRSNGDRCESPTTLDDTGIFDGLDDESAGDLSSAPPSPPPPPGIMEWKAYDHSTDDDDDDEEAQAGNAKKVETKPASSGLKDFGTKAVIPTSPQVGRRQGTETQSLDSHRAPDLEDIELEEEGEEVTAEDLDERYHSRKWWSGGFLGWRSKNEGKQTSVQKRHHHDDGNSVSLYSYDEELTMGSDNRRGIVAGATSAVNTSKDTSVTASEFPAVEHKDGRGFIEEGEEEVVFNHSKAQQSGRRGKSSTSWWSWLAEEHFCGIPYRWWLLLLILLFLLVILIVITVEFNKNSSPSSLSPTSPTSPSPPVTPPTTTMTPTFVSPTMAPTRMVPACRDIVQADVVMLRSGEALGPGEFRCSPGQEYLVGLTIDGDFVLREALTETTVWSAGITNGTSLKLNETIADNLVLLVVEDESGTSLFEVRAAPISEFPITDANAIESSGTVLTLTDRGLLSLQQPLSSSTLPATLWLEGVPQGQYNGPPATDLQSPIRGTFYFADYDTTFDSWQINGRLPVFEPEAGWYSSSDPSIIETHIDSLVYGNLSLGVIPWGGPGVNSERARITSLQAETERQSADLTWTIYYMKARSEPLVDEIRSDLEYLKTQYAWHPSWAHMQGLPMIFINNPDGCEFVQQHLDAANQGWFLVFRIFDGFDLCETNDFMTWNDHTGTSTDDGIDTVEGFYHAISPGAWRAEDDVPSLVRMGKEQWCQNVQGMIDSSEPLQMVVTFNDWRRGTMVETSQGWSTASGYGMFMDCLNDPASL